MRKCILSGSFNFEGPAVQLVPLHSRGVDDAWMRKHANNGVFSQFLSNFLPIPRKTVIHVLAVGDEETYGPNRNFDGFSRADNLTAHASFKDIGHVFKHHQNDDPFKAVGDVLQTAHHDLMNRIELLLSLDDEKCRNEVQAANRGEDIPVSMGSLQDFDLCSVCEHKAPTAQDHCDHIKNMLGLVLADGRRIYMKNPKPKYFDISLVFKPADRIAYMLRKVANAQNDRAIGGHVLAEIFGLSDVTPKVATLRALASIAKQVPGELRKLTAPKSVRADTFQKLCKQAQLHGIDHLLAFLSSNGWLLSPRDFGGVIGHKNPASFEPANDAFGGLDELLEDHSELPSLSAPPYVNPIQLDGSSRADLDACCSMDEDPVQKRVLRIVIMSPTKVAGILPPEIEARAMATLYGCYKVAFAEQNSSRPGALRAVATSFSLRDRAKRLT